MSTQKISGLFGVSRQAYYQQNWRQQARMMEEEILLQQVKQIREIHPRLGGRKVYNLILPCLEEHNIKMGRDKLFSLLSRHNMLIRRRKRKIRTTFSSHGFKIYPNLIRDIELFYPNQVWVSDITYQRIDTGFVYINFITDAYTKKILGFDVSDNLGVKGSLRALQKAIAQSYYPLDRVIHHSDRGIQYCSKAYTEKLKRNGFLISMSAKGNPLENAIAERINGIIKHEYVLGQKIKNLPQAKIIINKAVNTYNQYRPHLSCGYLTPDKAYEANPGSLKNVWKKIQTVNLCQD